MIDICAESKEAINENSVVCLQRHRLIIACKLQCDVLQIGRKINDRIGLGIDERINFLRYRIYKLAGVCSGIFCINTELKRCNCICIYHARIIIAGHPGYNNISARVDTCREIIIVHRGGDITIKNIK